MVTEHWDRRADIRVDSAERVVLRIAGEPGRLGILRNFSRGGAFIALVGSMWPRDVVSFDMLLAGTEINCTLRGSDQQGLHCQFGDTPANDRPSITAWEIEIISPVPPMLYETTE